MLIPATKAATPKITAQIVRLISRDWLGIAPETSLCMPTLRAGDQYGSSAMAAGWRTPGAFARTRPLASMSRPSAEEPSMPPPASAAPNAVAQIGSGAVRAQKMLGRKRKNRANTPARGLIRRKNCVP